MSKNMAKLYEKAWNKVVDRLPKWKYDLITQYKDDDPMWSRVSDEVVREAIKMAETWQYEQESAILSGHNNNNN